jgi:transcription termination factor Rho
MKYTEENLQKQKVRDLMKLATSVGVKGAWTMKKNEVIQAILQKTAKDGKNTEEEVEVPKKEDRMVAKQEYIETAPIGTLVAFYAPDGKVRTAKIMKRSVKNKKLKVETEYKAEYIIHFQDVLWVRTSNRWPRGVYNLLKGIKDND